MKITIIVFVWVFSSVCYAFDSQPMQSSSLDKNISISLVTKGVSVPWAMVQLPNQDILISERKGELRIFRNGSLLSQRISGLPNIHSNGQGGLLDLVLHPNFKDNHWLYFTYASDEGEEGGSNTALMRATLDISKFLLTEKKLLYKAEPNSTKRQHYGSRIVFDDRGYIFFSVGDRGLRDVNPQDISRDGGKIYRLHHDGRIPEDNPFVDKKGQRLAVFSYGHRNPQGLSIDPSTNLIWSHEHGPRGGDEVNVINKGVNYGWPVISYGINYNGTKFTDKTATPGMAQPALYWDPSIAPSGMIYVSSDIYPTFQHKFLIGSLKFGHLVLLTVKGDQVISQEKVFEGIGRARSLMQGNDGYIYVGIDGEGIKKLMPY